MARKKLGASELQKRRNLAFFALKLWTAANLLLSSLSFNKKSGSILFLLNLYSNLILLGTIF